MSEDKDFFKTCVDTVARLEVKNESQKLAKTVVLNEIENLKEDNKRLNGNIQTYYALLKANVEENEKLKHNWKKLKEWLNSFYKLSEFEQWEIVNKMQEIEQGSDSNEKD